MFLLQSFSKYGCELKSVYLCAKHRSFSEGV